MFVHFKSGTTPFIWLFLTLRVSPCCLNAAWWHEMEEPESDIRPMQRRQGALRVILASLAADSSLALIKIVAAVFSGSATMFAEAFHSIADTTNQVLLLLGRALSVRPPDEQHPFGYGKERYFWPFVVSIVIFSIGGILSFLRGVEQIRDPHELQYLTWNYLVLGLAICLEGLAWIVAWRELKSDGRKKDIIKLIRESKSPAVITVFLEDAAAVVGATIGIVGLALAEYTGLWMIDGITSIAIGMLLFSISIIIAIETKSLLIGESASPVRIRKIRHAVLSVPNVDRIGQLLTMHMSPDEILVNLDLQFKDNLTTDEIEEAIDIIETNIYEAVPEVWKIFIEAEAVASVVRRRK